MSLVALKCPNCGADLELEGTKEFAFCMHCGTKILIQEMVGRNSGSEAAKLKNLEDLALSSVRTGSSSDLRNTSMKILEIDSKNWVGWYVKGVAEAKDAQCYAMYDAWDNAVKNMTDEKYREMKPDIAYYAALGSIGYGIEDTKNGVPYNLLFDADDKESEGSTYLSIMIINEMCKFRDHITRDTVLNTLINACQIVYGHLSIYPNFDSYFGCYDSLMQLNTIVRNTKGVYGDLGEMLNCIILPFKMLTETWEKSPIPEEDFDKAVDYWIGHDWDECFKHFADAYDLADELIGAGSLSAMSIKRKMKKNIDTMLQVYVSHN